MLVVTAGIHGDEPSGADALPLLSHKGIATTGPCNPWGLRANRRTLENGRDLNRAFADETCPEAEQVRQSLREHAARPGGISLVLDLHEDSRATGPYLIQYGPGSDVGRSIVSALSERYPFERWPAFGPVVGSQGLILPSRAMVAVVGMSPWWPLVYWVWRTFGVPGVVVEAPGRWPLAERVAFHVTVAEAASGWLSSRGQRA